jgi:TetR/AcrR family transcriptional repressor of nem operon
VPKISKEDKATNRRNIVDAASRMFRTQGVDNVGIADLMQAAGLTHGGFYNHFPSKEALVAEVCQSAFAESREVFGKEMYEGDPEGAPPLAHVWSHYLSPRHRDAGNGGCPSSSLAVDAWRQGESIQVAYAEGIEGHIACFSDALLNEAAERGESVTPAAARDQAIRMLSTMVGAMVLARSVAHAQPDLSDEILEVNRQHYPG